MAGSFAPVAGTNEGTPPIISGHSGLTTPDPATSVTLYVCIHGYLTPPVQHTFGVIGLSLYRYMHV